MFISVILNLFSEPFSLKQKSLKYTLVLSLILFCLIVRAQDRQDIIKLKSGDEIQCQILNVYEADSEIQFCIKENGELKVKKIYAGMVDLYTWPGIDQASIYCRMLDVYKKWDGELYGVEPHDSLKPELASAELASKELKKAQALFHYGIATATLGLMTAIAVPYLLNDPGMSYNPFNSDDELEIYNKNVKTIRLVGSGIIFAGIIMEIASIKHYQNAKLLRQESQHGLSFSTGSDGLCLSYRF
jgi:hypothetical protein